ncbi:hypothetical protein ACI782_18475 [Geodermatophilus sp. SYSU D00703]
MEATSGDHHDGEWAHVEDGVPDPSASLEVPGGAASGAWPRLIVGLRR